MDVGGEDELRRRQAAAWSVRSAALFCLACGCSSGASGAADADGADVPLPTDGWDGGRDVDADRDADALQDDATDEGRPDAPIVPPHCGDGTVDPDEECDDGNRLDGDGCDWSCRVGDGVPPGPADPSTPRFEPEGEPGPLEGPWEGEWLDDGCYRVPFLWAGDSYALVTYLDGVGARIVHFDRSGDRVGPEWVLPNSSIFDAAWNGTGFAIVWCGDASGDASSEWIQILGADGKPVGDPILLARLPGESCHAAVVDWDGTGYAVFSLWDQHRLRFARTDEHGTTVADDRLLYAADDRDLYCLSGAAAEGTAAAVVWAHQLSEMQRTEYSVVDRSGEALRLASVIAEYSGGPPDIEWDGVQFGVLTFGETPTGPGFYLARLSPEGDLLGPPTLLGSCMARDLVLAAGLGWTTAAHGCGGRGALLFVRADTEGRVAQHLSLDSGGWDTFLPWALGLAFDGEGFGLVGVGPGMGGLLFARFVPVP